MHYTGKIQVVVAGMPPYIIADGAYMKIEIVRSFSALQSLADEWNKLLVNSASDVPFLRFEYLRTWWESMGGGEWPHGELYVALGRGEAGELCGIAPLFFTSTCDGLPGLMFLGSIEISDYLDFIAPPAQLPAFVAALCDTLAADPAWQALDLYNFLDHSPSLALLSQEAVRRGWHFNQEILQHCPFIELPGDFEKYLAEQVDKKQRHEIRRKMRRAEAAEMPVRWYIVDNVADLEGETEGFFELMSSDLEKARFLTPAMRTQMKTSVRAAFEAGWLQMAFLEVNGKKAAGYLNFDYRNTIWVYNSGLSPEFRELSPGWVLLGYLLQWANDHQRRNFDFMRGDEEYKYRFGAVDRRVMRARILR